MKNPFFKTSLVLTALLLIFGSAAMAQHGGKAEPNRIEFKRGSHSTTVNGSVHGDEQAEYVLAAKKGQRLIIRLTTVPAKSSCFDLKGPDQIDMGLEFDCNSGYSKLLPATGDYFISVARTSQEKGTSRYRLIVTVR